MDLTVIPPLVKEIGVYAFILVCLGLFTYKLVENQRVDAKEDKDILRKELEYNREVNISILNSNKELTETNRSLVDKFEGRMENIEGTLTKIDTKIDKMYERKCEK